MNQNRPQMPPAAPVPNPRSVRVPPLPADSGKTLANIKRLIWFYIVLLIFEGALRKWVVPQYSNPLLIVRDPIVVLIYILALSAGVFPRNRFVVSLGIIGVLSLIEGILILLPYLSPTQVALITAYGFRSNFFHLPLIFIIPAVFDAEDVRRLGWWIIVGTIPMALLMGLQFQASPESFINRAAGLGEGLQIQAGGGKIRPPATFSFISGAIFYLSMSAAFLLDAALSKFQSKMWLLVASGLSLIVGIAVSGSRSAVLAVGLVVASLAIVLVVRPDALNKFGRNLLVVAVVLFIVSRLPIFHEGLGILSDRFTESAEAADTTVLKGTVGRLIGGFTEPLGALDKYPVAGYGLGVGTNVGARFLIGRAAFLLAENEWTRILLESGSILGMAFLIWRTMLTFRIGYLSLVALSRGAILPILLFSAGFSALLNGSFGQPTSLGFAVVLNGLCLAAMKTPELEAKPTSEQRRPLPRVATRSAFASRLHGPTPDQTNGSVDR
jgi:hypothetical protein